MSSRRQNVKIGTKTSSPHSIITTAASPKTLGVSKKSVSIQKKPEKVASAQRTLVAVKNENGTRSLLVSKPNVSISTKFTEAGEATETIRRQMSTLQVESKVSILCRSIFTSPLLFIIQNHDKFIIPENRRSTTTEKIVNQKSCNKCAIDSYGSK